MSAPSEFSEWKLDRSAVSVEPLAQQGDDRAYWRSRTPLERLAAVEFLRQVAFGYDPATCRLKRVIEIRDLREI